LENRCSSEFLDFPLIGFKLGDDLLGVAHLLPCDHVVKIWWQLVLIWPQIGIFLAPGDFWATLFVLISRLADSPPLTPLQSAVIVHVTSRRSSFGRVLLL
jgi:hypothetical protein